MHFLFEKIKNVVAYLIIALALYGAYAAYQHWFKRKSVEMYESYVTGVSEDSSLVTGYAYVGVLWFRGDGETGSRSKRDMYVEDWYLAPPTDLPKPKFRVDPSKLRGVCYRLYRVTFGYRALKTALDAYRKGKDADASAVAARILAVETVETRAAKDFTEYECDQFDTKVDERQDAIERRLVLDNQLQPQLESGCSILAAYATGEKNDGTLASCQGKIEEQVTTITGRAKCYMRNALVDTQGAQCPPPTELMAKATERQARPEPLFGNNLGYLASLRVTLSTVGIITAESGWWVVKFEQFYVRRDLTEALYGSEIRDIRMRYDSDPPTLSVVAGEPDLISRNRFITIAVKSRSFNLPKELRQINDRRGYIEARMLDSIDGALNEISKPARRLSAQYLRAHLEQLAQTKHATLVLKLE